MGRRFWVGVFAVLSIGIVGCNTCLNPQPDLPSSSCGESDSNVGFGGAFGAGGTGSSAGGSSSGGRGSLNPGIGGSPGAGGSASESDGGASGSSSDAGAGGDHAAEPNGPEGGAAGAIGAAGAAGQREL